MGGGDRDKLVKRYHLLYFLIYCLMRTNFRRKGIWLRPRFGLIFFMILLGVILLFTEYVKGGS